MPPTPPSAPSALTHVLRFLNCMDPPLSTMFPYSALRTSMGQAWIASSTSCDMHGKEPSVKIVIHLNIYGAAGLDCINN